MISFLVILSIFCLCFSEIVFSDNGDYFDFTRGEVSIKMLEEMIKGGYKKSNFRTPSRTIVLSIKTPEDIHEIPEVFDIINDSQKENYEFVPQIKPKKVFDRAELVRELSRCGRECFIEAALDKPEGILETLSKIKSTLIVVSYQNEDISQILKKHQRDLVLMGNRARRVHDNKINKTAQNDSFKERRLLTKTSKEIIVRSNNGESNIDCYGEDWVEYIIPYTSQVEISNNQGMFWVCFVIAVSFLIVPIWMWFMNTEDPEDVGSTMAMDSNLSPPIEDERWEKE